MHLSDILIERKEYCENDGTYPHATLSKEGVDVKSQRYDRDFLVRTDDKKYKVTRLNDICYNPANLKFGVITRNKVGTLIFSPIYVTYAIVPTYDPYYIELALTDSNFIKYMLKYEEGTVYERMAVSSEDFLSETIRLPSRDKQLKFVQIMNFFSGVLITEQAIDNNLRLLKNYLISQMFI